MTSGRAICCPASSSKMWEELLVEKDAVTLAGALNTWRAIASGSATSVADRGADRLRARVRAPEPARRGGGDHPRGEPAHREPRLALSRRFSGPRRRELAHEHADFARRRRARAEEELGRRRGGLGRPARRRAHPPLGLRLRVQLTIFLCRHARRSRPGPMFWLRSGAHVRKYAPLRCSPKTSAATGLCGRPFWDLE